MGLALSVLVFSVGVLEALSCLEHVRQSYLPLEFSRKRRRLVVDLGSGTVRHSDTRRRSSLSQKQVQRQETGDEGDVCEELAAIWDRVEAGKVHSHHLEPPTADDSPCPSRGSTPATVIHRLGGSPADVLDIPLEDDICPQCIDENFDLLATSLPEDHIHFGKRGTCHLHDPDTESPLQECTSQSPKEEYSEHNNTPKNEKDYYSKPNSSTPSQEIILGERNIAKDLTSKTLSSSDGSGGSELAENSTIPDKEIEISCSGDQPAKVENVFLAPDQAYTTIIEKHEEKTRNEAIGLGTLRISDSFSKSENQSSSVEDKLKNTENNIKFTVETSNDPCKNLVEDQKCKHDFSKTDNSTTDELRRKDEQDMISKNFISEVSGIVTNLLELSSNKNDVSTPKKITDETPLFVSENEQHTVINEENLSNDQPSLCLGNDANDSVICSVQSSTSNNKNQLIASNSLDYSGQLKEDNIAKTEESVANEIITVEKTKLNDEDLVRKRLQKQDNFDFISSKLVKKGTTHSNTNEHTTVGPEEPVSIPAKVDTEMYVNNEHVMIEETRTKKTLFQELVKETKDEPPKEIARTALEKLCTEKSITASANESLAVSDKLNTSQEDGDTQTFPPDNLEEGKSAHRRENSHEGTASQLGCAKEDNQAEIKEIPNTKAIDEGDMIVEVDKTASEKFSSSTEKEEPQESSVGSNIIRIGPSEDSPKNCSEFKEKCNDSIEILSSVESQSQAALKTNLSGITDAIMIPASQQKPIEITKKEKNINEFPELEISQIEDEVGEIENVTVNVGNDALGSDVPIEKIADEMEDQKIAHKCDDGLFTDTKEMILKVDIVNNQDHAVLEAKDIAVNFTEKIEEGNVLYRTNETELTNIHKSEIKPGDLQVEESSSEPDVEKQLAEIELKEDAFRCSSEIHSGLNEGKKTAANSENVDVIGQMGDLKCNIDQEIIDINGATKSGKENDIAHLNISHKSDIENEAEFVINDVKKMSPKKIENEEESKTTLCVNEISPESDVGNEQAVVEVKNSTSMNVNRDIAMGVGDNRNIRAAENGKEDLCKIKEISLTSIVKNEKDDKCIDAGYGGENKTQTQRAINAEQLAVVATEINPTSVINHVENSVIEERKIHPNGNVKHAAENIDKRDEDTNESGNVTTSSTEDSRDEIVLSGTPSSEGCIERDLGQAEETKKKDIVDCKVNQSLNSEKNDICCESSGEIKKATDRGLLSTTDTDTEAIREILNVKSSLKPVDKDKADGESGNENESSERKLGADSLRDSICGSQVTEQNIRVLRGIEDDVSVLEGAEPPQTQGFTAVEDISSPDKAFWLIFSGEYTKAMSKDWHSGHFCCWQCDESLTGQRYVLRDDHPYCIKCYEQVFANTCDECSKVIGIDSKDLSYKDKHWHEACFLCSKCRVSLVDKQFGSKADKIYCGNCYDAQFASRCDGCGQIFRAGTKKMEYKTRQWHEQCFCCCVCKTAIGTKSFIPREQEIYCAGCYEEKFATRCVKCNKIITSGGVTYKNEPWHRECFTCTNCSTSLAGQRFTSRDEKPYCADCFGELFAKRCTACCKPITGIGGTRFISFEDRHWHNDCFICASCRTSLVGRGFITDAEDILCTECAKQKLM